MRIIQFGIIALSMLSARGSSPGAELYLLALSGDRQIGAAGQLLPEPIVARLTDDAGNGVMDQSLVFATDDKGGWLIDASGAERSQLILQTDARGDAAAEFRLGPGTDKTNILVRVSSPGAASQTTFSFQRQCVADVACEDFPP